MNSTDILFNNGQLNWDAISTISNIILVTALVLVTLWYAWQVRKQTKSMEKGMRKNRSLEEIQDVLTPTIYSLEKEIEAIEKNKIFGTKALKKGYLKVSPKFMVTVVLLRTYLENSPI